MIKYQLNFRTARISDITNLVDLINSAYRQQDGRSWTSESEIVTGDRINAKQLKQALAQNNFQLFVAELDEHIVACIDLAFIQHDVEIGTFCIAAQLQNQGIGKYVLDFAEQYVHDKVLSNHCHSTHFVMWVLSVRHELIAYYQRRGYVQTGVVADYPLNANVGIPVVDLHLIEMRKRVPSKVSSN
ncbi:GNAT family N-acetyltransferase [Acinetobacter guillouiae]|uniref:GNAT family N-acetyltransferase n=1 Tax=Acinetobacter guillouiae TaxID=106649 RepID=UPI0021D1F348|nr:GNAT family N-acetyltransferase [Acinetobacter guillouiae]MCU4492537.1 GNAT family N-acetyltransferase [Acinetobacter guillouiae]